MNNAKQNYRVAIKSNSSTAPVMVRSVEAYGFMDAVQNLEGDLNNFEVTRGRYLKKLSIDIELFDNSKLEGFGEPRKKKKK